MPWATVLAHFSVLRVPWGTVIVMADEEPPKRARFPLFFGRRAVFADVKKTFWDGEMVKHDPEDTDSKDWANSEPDPNAP